ncbi:NAD(P)-dependent dehydrogenase (short-subunit alcohol dehydrogenase family) [Kribbella orskensis]|uniref:NAD(P)-dependent dehydrogenase (Short-subunit alcohol dehydrogenase family) n=1 Tax=Kribbella orskensis TaxID=2512216 RepID=A0ABY2BVT4_9ACTN|nr:MULTISPECIES: SDR family oxidoreductase [Kribbella]TCN44094.1 NAD(P)-dependent dehydrogenase (short-subunit alcohol dehydrogenase family) [Kribbella sp. VKM Ac-2500]TCO32128.1 NAD(P)-dependent dehydrogenase (short-subunit alcohol dehydrogenase family) [Kribbella orskensis]
MDLHLAGKTALVTGASKGIGLAITRGLLDEGVKVVAGARSVDGQLGSLPVETVSVDLSTPDGPADFVAEAVTRTGGFDILVNNVGFVHPRPGGFVSVTDEDWLATWTLDFLSAVRTTRAALPHLLERTGTIVTVCSVNAILPDPLVIDYSAAKAASSNFFKALSKEVGPQGVRVNTVSPGPVSTDLWLGKGGVAETVAGAVGGEPDAVAAQAAAGSVTGRFTTPEEVAALVVFLASDRAGNLTGADIVIDGGLTPTL